MPLVDMPTPPDTAYHLTVPGTQGLIGLAPSQGHIGKPAGTEFTFTLSLWSLFCVYTKLNVSVQQQIVPHSTFPNSTHFSLVNSHAQVLKHGMHAHQPFLARAKANLYLGSCTRHGVEGSCGA